MLTHIPSLKTPLSHLFANGKKVEGTRALPLPPSVLGRCLGPEVTLPLN